jgi:hypothetical protein
MGMEDTYPKHDRPSENGVQRRNVILLSEGEQKAGELAAVDVDGAIGNGCEGAKSSSVAAYEYEWYVLGELRIVLEFERQKVGPDNRV